MTTLQLPFARARRRLRSVRRSLTPSAPPVSAPPRPAGVWFGLGTVRGEAPDGRVRVRLADDLASTVEARWALPYRYLPEPGDTVWVTRQAQAAYVLGVVHGRGRSELLFQGDVLLGARGTLRLVAARGLRVVGEVVTLRTQALEVAAQTLQEHAQRWTQRVRGLRSLRAGDVFRHTEETETLLAREVAIRASESVRLDAGDVVAVS